MLNKLTTVSNVIFFAVLLGIVTPGLAAPPEGKGGGKGGGGDTACEEGIFSPVILAGEFFVPSRPVQMSEDGSCFQVIATHGDLTHNGVKGQRYFLTSEPSQWTLPNGSVGYDLVAYNEDGDPETRRVLTSDQSINRLGQPRWSIDGTQVAYVGARYDLDFGDVVEQGIFLGEVTHDFAGAPDQIVEERLVIGADPNEYLFPALSWSGDRIAYGTSRPVYDSNGGVIDFEREIYVADMSLGVSYEIQLADGGSATYPSFSPADNRLAFTRTTSTTGCFRTDIYVVVVPEGYNGTHALPATQITNQKNAKRLCQIRRAYWSPMVTYLAFDAWASIPYSGMQIYKIKSDGSGNAVQLTNSKTQGYVVTGWRD